MRPDDPRNGRSRPDAALLPTRRPHPGAAGTFRVTIHAPLNMMEVRAPTADPEENPMPRRLALPPSLVLRGRLAVLAGLALALAATPPATGQEVVSASPDITIAIGSGNLVTSDEDVAIDNQLGIVVLENLGSLPDASDVVAVGLAANGDRLFVLDTTTSLAGGVVASPRDVIRFDGASYTKELDGNAAGLSSGVTIDAVSIAPGGLLLSFDTTVNLSGLVVDDEDLVRWNGSTFTLALDGSLAGLDGAHDIDAAQDLGFGAFLVSLDTTGSVGGIVADDEDVLRFDGSVWSLEFDASAADSDWSAADLDAILVPEPGLGALLGGGLGVLGVLARRRRHG
jgi:hypothetical protein